MTERPTPFYRHPHVAPTPRLALSHVSFNTIHRPLLLQLYRFLHRRSVSTSCSASWSKVFSRTPRKAVPLTREHPYRRLQIVVLSSFQDAKNGNGKSAVINLVFLVSTMITMILLILLISIPTSLPGSEHAFRQIVRKSLCTFVGLRPSV